MQMIERSQLGYIPVADIIAVASEDNPADPGSRGVAHSDERERTMFYAMQWHEKGIRWTSRRRAHDGSSDIRHEETRMSGPTMR